ncbi:MAG TPA: LptA/OstA family protein [Paracoccaceae bacterium]|nr:LptA/OstA family protein [Paracoccaceae bacterium]
MRKIVSVAMLGCFLAGAVWAQGAQIPFAGLAPGSAEAVEVTADSLQVDQASGRAVFAGDVLVGFGPMRLAAQRVEVVYDTADGSQGAVGRLIADGQVTFTNGVEAAEAQSADLDLRAGILTMKGDVILTQGGNVLAGQSLVVDLNAGTALVEGRVQTILQTGTGN